MINSATVDDGERFVGELERRDVNAENLFDSCRFWLKDNSAVFLFVLVSGGMQDRRSDRKEIRNEIDADRFEFIERKGRVIEERNHTTSGSVFFVERRFLDVELKARVKVEFLFSLATWQLEVENEAVERFEVRDRGEEFRLKDEFRLRIGRLRRRPLVRNAVIFKVADDVWIVETVATEREAIIDGHSSDSVQKQNSFEL